MKILFFLLLLIVVFLLFLPVNTESPLIPIPDLVFDHDVYIVSFAYKCCKKAQKNLEETAVRCGATKVFSLTLDTLEAPENVKEYIKSNKKGAGYWIWKAYALKQILKVSKPYDIVIYTDASTYFNNTLQPIVNFINEHSILVFKHSDYNKQSQWTKMNAVKYFGYPDDWCETEGEYTQFMAAFIGVKNNEIGNNLVNKYLDVMKPENSKLFDDTRSTVPNCKGFKESRHDQQMLSLILYKYFTNIPFPTFNKNEYNWTWHENIKRNSRHA
jgi:hypothetical protein